MLEVSLLALFFEVVHKFYYWICLVSQVRVPTHDGGCCLFWEFATDSYDIGFGVYFEWEKPLTKEVSVHISETEDEDSDDLDDEPGNFYRMCVLLALNDSLFQSI